MYAFLNSGSVSLLKAAQCGQVSEPYSIIVTGADGSPSERSASEPGCRTFAISTVPSGCGAEAAKAPEAPRAPAQTRATPARRRRDAKAKIGSSRGWNSIGATLPLNAVERQACSRLGWARAAWRRPCWHVSSAASDWGKRGARDGIQAAGQFGPQ